MPIDIQRMAREELDHLNRQIAIYRKSRDNPKDAVTPPTESAGSGKQLQLFKDDDFLRESGQHLSVPEISANTG
jgi:hypothetical protein